MRYKILGITLLIMAVVLAHYLTLYFADLWLPDGFQAKESVAFVQSAITVVAIVVAGFYAIAKWELFRDFEPHLNISHVVNHRSIGDSYVHLDVTVTMRNSSKVKVDLERGFLILQRISPSTDEMIERVYQEALSGQYVEDFAWPVLEEQIREWQRKELAIEPGEAYSELLEFIVSEVVETVQVYTFYYDSRSPGETTGWGMATVYDIMD